MAVYKDNDRGTWYCKFYYVNWQGEKKQKLKRGFKLQREAKDWERKFLEQFAKDPDITFETLYKKYMEYLSLRVRESTLETRTGMLKNHVLPYFKNYIVSDITPTNILEWQNQMLKKGLSESYTHTINVYLKAVFTYAVEYQGLQKNPCNKAIGSLKCKNVDFWTPEEYKKFIDCCKDNIEYYTLFEILYYTGMRVGEVLALTINDIDFKNCIINVNKTYYRIAGKDLINPPKTEGSERAVYVPQFLIDEIQEYIRHLYKPDPGQRLFDKRPQYVRSILMDRAKKAGVKQIRVHDLRHSHASMLINLGANPLLVAQRLGHESPEITLKTYSHLFPTVQTGIVNKIEKL